MPVDIKFNKQEVAPNSDFYAIKLVSTPALVKTVKNDTITFTRIGKDHDLGFTITFEGDNPPGDVTAASGDDTATLTVDNTDETLEWKYTVSFPNDDSKGDIVADLDPIIIINPGINSSRSPMRDLAVFVGGAVVTYLAARFIPGILG